MIKDQEGIGEEQEKWFLEFLNSIVKIFGVLFSPTSRMQLSEIYKMCHPVL